MNTKKSGRLRKIKKKKNKKRNTNLLPNEEEGNSVEDLDTRKTDALSVASCAQEEACSEEDVSTVTLVIGSERGERAKYVSELEIEINKQICTQASKTNMYAYVRGFRD